MLFLTQGTGQVIPTGKNPNAILGCLPDCLSFIKPPFVYFVDCCPQNRETEYRVSTQIFVE